MKVLIIGATGYVGSTIVENFKKQKHELYGLARSEEAYKKIEGMGIKPISGDLFKPETIRAATEQVDAVIHTALPGNPFNNGAPAFDEDHKAIEAMLDSMKGTNKVFIYTTGAMAISDFQKIGEAVPKVSESTLATNPPLFVAKRAQTENMILQAAEHGIRTVVIRVPHVYGKGKNFVLPYLINEAMKKETSLYINKGENIFSLVHVDDLAELYALAIEKSQAGKLYHPTGFEMNMKDIATAVSEKMGLNGQTKSITFEEAKEIWGEGPALVIGLNARLNSDQAVNLLNWMPQNKSLDDEIVEVINTIRSSKS